MQYSWIAIIVAALVAALGAFIGIRRSFGEVQSRAVAFSFCMLALIVVVGSLVVVVGAPSSVAMVVVVACVVLPLVVYASVVLRAEHRQRHFVKAGVEANMVALAREASVHVASASDTQRLPFIETAKPQKVSSSKSVPVRSWRASQRTTNMPPARIVRADAPSTLHRVCGSNPEKLDKVVKVFKSSKMGRSKKAKSKATERESDFVWPEPLSSSQNLSSSADTPVAGLGEEVSPTHEESVFDKALELKEKGSYAQAATLFSKSVQHANDARERRRARFEELSCYANELIKADDEASKVARPSRRERRTRLPHRTRAAKMPATDRPRTSAGMQAMGGVDAENVVFSAGIDQVSASNVGVPSCESAGDVRLTPQAPSQHFSSGTNASVAPVLSSTSASVPKQGDSVVGSASYPLPLGVEKAARKSSERPSLRTGVQAMGGGKVVAAKKAASLPCAPKASEASCVPLTPKAALACAVQNTPAPRSTPVPSSSSEGGAQASYASYIKRAHALKEKGSYAVAARLFAQGAAVGSDARSCRDARFEELSCYVKADQVDRARELARDLRDHSTTMTKIERVKLDAVLRML